MLSLTVNGKQYQVDVPVDTPLLWVLRDSIGLTGTKDGCGKALRVRPPSAFPLRD